MRKLMDTLRAEPTRVFQYEELFFLCRCPRGDADILKVNVRSIVKRAREKGCSIKTAIGGGYQYGGL